MNLLTISESKGHGDYSSTDNGAIHLALMIWFVGMNDTRVMECTSLYYKLKNQFIPKDNSDPYWQFVYCARRVLGMGEWEDIENWADIENDKPQDEALKKFRSVLSTSLSESFDSDLSQIN